VLSDGDQVVFKIEQELELERRLGDGGFSSVYLLKNNTGQEYALKILDLWRFRPSEYEETVDKFRKGYDVGKVRGPHLVRTYSYGLLRGNPYILMEYCPGGTLKAKIKDRSCVNDASPIAQAILKGLKALHQNALVHRDIKPENILFDADSQIKLADFDIVLNVNEERGTTSNLWGHANQVWGTRLYAAPEQIDHRKAIKYAHPRMDIYSFGVVMWEVLFGAHPYQSLIDEEDSIKTAIKKIRSNYSNLKRRVEDKPEWRDLLLGCLNPDFEGRFQNVEEVLTHIPNLKEATVNGTVCEFGHFLLKPSQDKVDLAGLVKSKKEKIVTVGFGDDAQSANDINIPEEGSAFISRHHATIEYIDKEWFIKDGQWIDHPTGPYWKYSTNGTYVNSRKLEPTETCLLRPGDTIRVGNTELIFQ
jgi:serine/threonine protein kinase